MEFVYLSILAGISGFLCDRDIHGNLHIAEGAFGVSVKNDNACNIWHDDCHTCVSACCEYNSSKEHCYLHGG